MQQLICCKLFLQAVQTVVSYGTRVPDALRINLKGKSINLNWKTWNQYEPGQEPVTVQKWHDHARRAYCSTGPAQSRPAGGRSRSAWRLPATGSLALTALSYWQASGSISLSLSASAASLGPGPGLQLSAAPEAAMVKFMMMATAYKWLVPIYHDHYHHEDNESGCREPLAAQPGQGPPRLRRVRQLSAESAAWLAARRRAGVHLETGSLG